MRAAIYARYSSENQRPESLEDQIAACRRFAVQREFTVLDERTRRSLVRDATGMASRLRSPARKGDSFTSFSSMTCPGSLGTTI